MGAGARGFAVPSSVPPNGSTPAGTAKPEGQEMEQTRGTRWAKSEHQSGPGRASEINPIDFASNIAGTTARRGSTCGTFALYSLATMSFASR